MWHAHHHGVLTRPDHEGPSFGQSGNLQHQGWPWQTGTKRLQSTLEMNTAGLAERQEERSLLLKDRKNVLYNQILTLSKGETDFCHTLPVPSSAFMSSLPEWWKSQTCESCTYYSLCRGYRDLKAWPMAMLLRHQLALLAARSNGHVAIAALSSSAGPWIATDP